MVKQNFNLKTAGAICNGIEACGVAFILLLAFTIQIVFNELPCPLCLLQRVGFCMIAVGFLMNLKFGLHPSHYAMVILGCIYTAMVALRQIALHVIPGTGSYGSELFGFHLYTWSFVGASVILVFTTILMSVDRQYLKPIPKKHILSKITNILLGAFIILLCINLVAVFIECGLTQCPDNPNTYL